MLPPTSHANQVAAAGRGVRFGQYHLEYNYDGSGSRLIKTDFANNMRTRYRCDTDRRLRV